MTTSRLISSWIFPAVAAAVGSAIAMAYLLYRALSFLLSLKRKPAVASVGKLTTSSKASNPRAVVSSDLLPDTMKPVKKIDLSSSSSCKWPAQVSHSETRKCWLSSDLVPDVVDTHDMPTINPVERRWTAQELYRRVYEKPAHGSKNGLKGT